MCSSGLLLPCGAEGSFRGSNLTASYFISQFNSSKSDLPETHFPHLYRESITRTYQESSTNMVSFTQQFSTLKRFLIRQDCNRSVKFGDKFWLHFPITQKATGAAIMEIFHKKLWREEKIMCKHKI